MPTFDTPPAPGSDFTAPRTMVGGVGNDTLMGGAGNDSLYGAAGDDVMDGGVGIDTAAFVATRSGYVVTRSTGTNALGVTSGAEGRDALANIERLRFSDVGLAFDLDGHAGQTVKLLGAVFGVGAVANRQYVGIGLSLLDDGMSYEQLASLAVAAAGKTSHADVVALLWANLFGSAPTVGQAAPVVALLDAGMSIGALTVLAADLSLNTDNINLVGLSQIGIEFV